MWPLTPLYGGGFVVALAQLTVFYYSAGALLHWVVPALLPVEGIQKSARTPGDVQRDALGSIGPLMVKAAVWTLVELCYSRGWGFLYAGQVTSLSQALYLLMTIVVLDYVHDAWFYWTHRLLHWGPLYRRVHHLHHQSKAPSAFTGYSFHVLEAALVFANEVLMVFVMPMHIGLHRIYHIFTTLIHQGGHAGYEIAPLVPHVSGLLALATHGLCGTPANNTVQYHDQHHRHPKRHFSLYFTHWDRWCHTVHPDYDATLFTYFGGRPGAGQAAAAGAGPKGKAGVEAAGVVGGVKA